MSDTDPCAATGGPGVRPAASRVAWVDYAKGWCIVSPWRCIRPLAPVSPSASELEQLAKISRGAPTDRASPRAST